MKQPAAKGSTQHNVTQCSKIQLLKALSKICVGYGSVKQKVAKGPVKHRVALAQRNIRADLSSVKHIWPRLSET